MGTSKDEIAKLRQVAAGPRTLDQMVLTVEGDIRRANRRLQELYAKWEAIPKEALDLLTKAMQDMRHWEVRRRTLIDVWEMMTQKVWTNDPRKK